MSICLQQAHTDVLVFHSKVTMVTSRLGGTRHFTVKVVMWDTALLAALKCPVKAITLSTVSKRICLKWTKVL